MSGTMETPSRFTTVMDRLRSDGSLTEGRVKVRTAPPSTSESDHQTIVVRLGGTNFCLDAGSNPGNGIKMKICMFALLARIGWVADGRSQGLATITSPLRTGTLPVSPPSAVERRVLIPWQVTIESHLPIKVCFRLCDKEAIADNWLDRTMLGFDGWQA
jgi:hypothetical protein